MALPGEVGYDSGDICGAGCDEKLIAGPMQSAAGWYWGTYCPKCGPYSRETGYYALRQDVLDALMRGELSWRF